MFSGNLFQSNETENNFHTSIKFPFVHKNHTLFGYFNGSNLTSPSFLTWTADLALSLSFIIVGLLTNFSVLLVILKNNHLRTPFTVYLINLLTVNLVYFTFDAPMKLIDGLYQHWWLGDNICTLYLYLTFNIETIIFSSHALITINRIWATTLPVSYKTYHSKRLAALLCFFVWAFVHFLGVPMIIRDGLYFRLNTDKYGCIINEVPQYTLRVFIHVLNDGCGILVVGAYPFLWYKKRQREKRNQIGAQSTQRSTRATTSLGNASTSQTGERRTVKERSYAFTVLTFLTVNVLVCWTSLQIYYGLLLFKVNVDAPVIFKVAYLLLDFAPVMDPVYFTMALKDLRTAFVIMFMFAKNKDRIPQRQRSIAPAEEEVNKGQIAVLSQETYC